MIVHDMAWNASDAARQMTLLGDWLTMLAAIDRRGTGTDRIITTLLRLFVVANIGK